VSKGHEEPLNAGFSLDKYPPEVQSFASEP
jgi:hypothetical protein